MREPVADSPVTKVRATSVEEVGNGRKGGAGAGTDVVVAAHPSTGVQPAKHDLLIGLPKEKRELSPRQRCQAAEVVVTGCAQKHVSEDQCHDALVGKYVLLEDDVIPHQTSSRSAFMCVVHGKEYNVMIKEKRRSRPGCWDRGCRWEKDDTWSIECPQHMITEKVEGVKKQDADDQTIQRSVERIRWEKAPGRSDDPSSPSGTKRHVPPEVMSEGMAVAACPSVVTEEMQRQKVDPSRQRASDPPNLLEDIQRKVSTAHVEKADLLDAISDQVRMEGEKRADKPVTKPGILLNVQFENELKHCNNEATKEPVVDREQRGPDPDDEESPCEKMRKMTVRRKDQVDESNDGPSDGSWGEIRSHLRNTKKRRSTEEPECRRTEKRTSLDSARSSRKRAHSRNSLSSR